MKIVVLEAARIGNDVSFDCLKDFGALIVYEETNSSREVAERIKDADIIIVDQLKLNADSLSGAKKLKYITMTSTGTDFVDFNFTRKHQIKVANIRGYSTHSVAQHTFGLLFYLYEKLAFFDDYVTSGRYIDDVSNSSFSTVFSELYGKTYGIAGLGSIGKEVAAIASAFGCKVIYYSPSGHTYPVDYPSVDFDTLLKESDIISVHTPLTPQTEQLFDYAAFLKMKETALFLNVARGGIVEEEGLARALREHQIAGAGLDVLVQEPMSPDCPFSDMLNEPNLFITPHMGWAAKESRQRAVMEIYQNIKSFLQGTDRNVIQEIHKSSYKHTLTVPQSPEYL